MIPTARVTAVGIILLWHDSLIRTSLQFALINGKDGDVVFIPISFHKAHKPKPNQTVTVSQL